MNRFVEYMKEGFERSSEYSKNVTETMQNLTKEASEKATSFMKESFDHSKEFLNCKTFDDVIDWGEKLVKKNIDALVDSSSSFYGKTCQEINRVNSEVSKKFASSMANMKKKFDEN